MYFRSDYQQPQTRLKAIGSLFLSRVKFFSAIELDTLLKSPDIACVATLYFYFVLLFTIKFYCINSKMNYNKESSFKNNVLKDIAMKTNKLFIFFLSRDFESTNFFKNGSHFLCFCWLFTNHCSFPLH